MYIICIYLNNNVNYNDNKSGYIEVEGITGID